MTIFLIKIDTPEETPGVRRSYQEKLKINSDYLPSMSGKQYETVNNQVEYKETLHPDAHMFLYQELIEEVTDAEAVIMTH